MVRGPIRVAVAALVVLLVGLAPAVVAAGQPAGGKGEGTARTPARVTVTRVKMINFAFRPRSLTISAGTKVRWADNEGTHSTTSNTGLWTPAY